MFIGNLVKLKSNVIRNNKRNKEFIKNALKYNWIWLITGMDNKNLDYIIQPLYLDTDCSNMIKLGKKLLVLHNEIEKIKLNRDEIFTILNKENM